MFRNLYTCPPSSEPRHMSVAIDKFKYRLPYKTIFGGATALRSDDFRSVGLKVACQRKSSGVHSQNFSFRIRILPNADLIPSMGILQIRNSIIRNYADLQGGQ